MRLSLGQPCTLCGRVFTEDELKRRSELRSISGLPWPEGEAFENELADFLA